MPTAVPQQHAKTFMMLDLSVSYIWIWKRHSAQEVTADSNGCGATKLSLLFMLIGSVSLLLVNTQYCSTQELRQQYTPIL